MSIPRFLCILLSFAMVSCQPSAKPNGTTSPSNSEVESKNGTITVTVDGREATPEEKEAFGTFGKQVLSEVFSKAFNEAWQEFLKKLEVTDAVETELFSVPFGPQAASGDELWSVYLIRPGNEMKGPRTIVLLLDDKSVIRFSRTTGPVERPMAIMSMTTVKNGRLMQTETFLVYTDGKWKQYRPIERDKSVK